MTFWQQIVLGSGAVFEVEFPGAALSGQLAVSVAFQTDGDLSFVEDGSESVGSWVSPKPPPDSSNWEIRATVSSGSVDAGSAATGTFLSLGTTRQWLKNSVGSVVFDVDIRRTGTTQILDTAEYTLTINA